MPDLAILLGPVRAVRWALLTFALLTSIHFFQRSFSSPKEPVDIASSSFDWSLVIPHHPLPPIQSLPIQTQRSLRRVQHASSKPHRYDIGEEQSRCKAVKLAAEKFWTQVYNRNVGSRDQAILHDDVTDPFSPRAAFLIDSLDTLWIMNMKKEFNEALQIVRNFDWSATQRKSINILDTTTRYIGGLLAAYDLSKERVLLRKAHELGDMLYTSFDTTTHMPPIWLDFDQARSGRLEPENNQPATSITGLSLEFTRLSQLTGDDKYYHVVARVINRLEDWQNRTKIIGLWPSYFDLKDDTFNHDNVFSLGAASGTTYEYLVKMHALLGGADERYQNMYHNASDALIKTLLFKPMTTRQLDVVFPGTFRLGDKVQLDAEIQQLSCFSGGLFMLAGKLFNYTEHLNIGAKLTNGCMWAYTAFPHSLAPDAFSMVPCPGGLLDMCKWDENRWRSHLEDNHYAGRQRLPMGFLQARSPAFTLRPETIESMFISYRVTGHEEYREAAWNIFQAIQKATETENGLAAISDVTAETLQHYEYTESYWLSETLKYFYLLFSAPEVVNLDEYVFNTGGHPLRLPNT